MASATTMVPLEEYLATSYEHDPEWVDGELRERSVPDTFQSLIQKFFILYFAALEVRFGLQVYQEARIRVAPRRFRLPDVLVLPAGAPFQRVPDTPPLVCVEVLSLDDSMSEMQEKIADYVRMGATAIWLVDPRKRTMYVADGTGTWTVDEFTLPALEVRITRAEIFAQLDRLVADAEGVA